jgi:NAD(P)-dependent dehydrogenase (short-subunit alcohol dehydrogenase family)
MDTLWRVNVAGMARMLKACAPHLGEGAAVVNIASLTGLIGRLERCVDVRRVEGRRDGLHALPALRARAEACASTASRPATSRCR